MTKIYGAQLTLLGLTLAHLAGCGGGCPDGFEENKDDKSCTCPAGTILNEAGDGCIDVGGDDGGGSGGEETDTDTDTDNDTDTDTDADTDADTDTDVLPEGLYDGELTFEAKVDPDDEETIIRPGYDASLLGWSAWSYAEGDRLVVYMSSTPDVSCEEVALYLGKDPDDNPETPRPAYDPTGLFTANTCNLSLTWNDAGYGEYSESSPADFRETLEPLAFVECPLGEGSFVSTSFGGSAGYYWLNEEDANLAWWFTGRAAWGEVTRLEQVADGVEVDAEVDLIDGEFPIAAEAEEATPRGTGKGTIVAPNCPDLGDTPLFE